MSRQFLGIQIDAVYHTSIVFGGIEYYFGQGVQTCRAGATHHGRPMEVIKLGQTALPMEVILEYLESLKKIYTPEVSELHIPCHKQLLTFSSHTICLHITVITSQTILQCSLLAKEYRIISLLFRKPFSTRPLGKCSNRRLTLPCDRLYRHPRPKRVKYNRQVQVRQME